MNYSKITEQISGFPKIIKGLFLGENFNFTCLTVVLGIIIGTNFVPGTWLSGFDNLHPEFDFPLNVSRSIFAVWQEYQGLGLLGGMAHAADLPRQLFLWAISVFLPLSSLRYFYHFLMLGMGTFGTYFLLRNFILDSFADSPRQKGALLSALFYLLNLGTSQYFYVPFEPYSTFWGMLPWELTALLQFLKIPSRRNLAILALVNFISIPQAYVQTIFLVYMLMVGLILFISFKRYRSRFALKNHLKIILLIFTINAFWLLPNLYFTFRGGWSETRDSMNNQMNTERFYQQNKRRGNLSDFIYLKEFYYDFLDADKASNGLFYMMETWRNHYESTAVQYAGLLFFVIILSGLSLKSRYRSYVLILFALSLLVFLSNVPILSQVNDFLRRFPILSQIFRNPFTKFIVPAIWVFSVGFGIGTGRLFAYISEKNKSGFLNTFIFTVMLAGLVYYGLPQFTGNLFYYRMRVRIPDEYFQLFQALKEEDPNGRIMNLPQDSYWGWGGYGWGGIGSGFLWYGIEQPVMDRAFDVWSSPLENYYWELSYALRSRNQELFNTILEKYQIRYILFDGSYYPSDSGSSKSLILQSEILQNNPKVIFNRKFNKLSLYNVSLNNRMNQNMSKLLSVSKLLRTEKYENMDRAFEENGNYINGTVQQFDSVYPFGTLFSGRFPSEQNFRIYDEYDSMELKVNIPQAELNINPVQFPNEDDMIPVQIYARKFLGDTIVRFTIIYPQIFIDNMEITRQGDFSRDFYIPDTGNLRVVINGTDMIDIRDATAEFTKFGAAYILPVQQQVSVNVYSAGENGYLLADYRIDSRELTKDILNKTGELIGNTVSVRIPLLLSKYSMENLIRDRNGFQSGIDNGKSIAGEEFVKEEQQGRPHLVMHARDTYVNFWTDINNIPLSSGYVLKVTARNVTGNPLVVNVNIPDSDIKLINTKLISEEAIRDYYFIIPPYYPFDKGLKLIFHNASYYGKPSVNELYGISLYPFPYETLSGIRLTKSGVSADRESMSPDVGNVIKNHNAYYTLEMPSGGQSAPESLVLSQSYDDGWHMYKLRTENSELKNMMNRIFPFISGEDVGEHVKVNGWANGWNISNQSPTTHNPQPTTILIVYLPQYLEYAGFAMLLLVPLFFVNIRKRRKRKLVVSSK